MKLVFNSDADGQDIVSQTLFLLGGKTTADFALKDIARNSNLAMSLIWEAIFQAYGGWQFVDDNVANTTTGVPYADQTVTNNQGRYGLPTGSLAITGAEIKYLSGSFTKLTPITREEFLGMNGDGRFSAPGVPVFYLLDGSIMTLLPTPNYTQVASLRIFFDQEMTAFASSATTQIPGFASVFHEAIPTFAALQYAKAKNLTARIVSLNNDWVNYIGNPANKITGSIQAFYSKRYKDRFPNRIGSGADIVEEYS